MVHAPQETNLKEWLLINLKVGVLSFGSASRVLLYEDELIARRSWVTPEQFRETLTLAQILPGPNLVNLAACLGFRLFKPWQAVLGVLTLTLPGALFAIFLVNSIPMENPHIRELFKGFAIGAFLLFAKFLWNLGQGLKSSNRLGQDAHRGKIAYRWCIAALLMALGLGGVSVLRVIALGLPACLFVEFAL